jgi:hypothetical protein
VAIFDLWENGSFGLLSAFGITILTGLIIASLVASWVSSKFGVKDQ